MIELVVIGASAGGISAIQTIFRNLSAPLKVPVVIVLHIHKDTQMALPLIFGNGCKGQFLEARDKSELEPGLIYFAPPDYHLLVEDKHTLALTQEAPVLFSRPAIDMLFESAAYVFNKNLCGILLTGASADGAHGLKVIKAHGGLTVVQDPDEAEAATMPMAAQKLFRPDAVLNLVDIAKRLSSLEERHDDAYK